MMKMQKAIRIVPRSESLYKTHAQKLLSKTQMCVCVCVCVCVGFCGFARISTYSCYALFHFFIPFLFHFSLTPHLHFPPIRNLRFFSLYSFSLPLSNHILKFLCCFSITEITKKPFGDQRVFPVFFPDYREQNSTTRFGSI